MIEEQQPDNGAASKQDKHVWSPPTYRRIGVKEAEAGILVGPEILILLS